MGVSQSCAWHLEHDVGLEAGQRGAEAEVGAEPEAQVWVGPAVDAHLAGVLPEDGLVPVGRRVHEQDRVARCDRDRPDPR